MGNRLGNLRRDQNTTGPSEEAKAILEERNRIKALHLNTGERDGRIVCSCGLHIKGLQNYYHHIESYQHLKPFNATGWPQRHFETIPNGLRVQLGVVARGSIPYVMFTTIKLKPGADRRTVQQAVGAFQTILNDFGTELELEKLQKPGQPEVTELGKPQTTVVGYVALSADTWIKWDSAPPAHLKPFETKYQAGTTEVLFPQTGGDVLLLIKSQELTVTQDATDKVLAHFQGLTETVTQYPGFLHHGKDLTGFIDGTRNPDHLLRAVFDEAIIFAEDEAWTGASPGGGGGEQNDLPGSQHAGGSYIFAGRFVHDLDKFRGMCPAAQSSVVGRDITKVQDHVGYDRRPENPQMDPLPQDSHVARGHGSMYRQAYPYISGTEKGLYFTAASRHLEELDAALNRMCGMYADDKSPDRLMSVTTCVSANYYYAPCIQELEALADGSLEAKREVDDAKSGERVDEAKYNMEAKSETDPLVEIMFEYCTNCGYNTAYYERSRLLRSIYPNIKIVGNPMLPRQSAFEIKALHPSGGNDGVLWSKLAQRDGKNNYPHVFPQDEDLAEAFTNWLNNELGVNVTGQYIPSSQKYGAVGVW